MKPSIEVLHGALDSLLRSFTRRDLFAALAFHAILAREGSALEKEHLACHAATAREAADAMLTELAKLERNDTEPAGGYISGAEFVEQIATALPDAFTDLTDVIAGDEQPSVAEAGLYNGLCAHGEAACDDCGTLADQEPVGDPVLELGKLVEQAGGQLQLDGRPVAAADLREAVIRRALTSARPTESSVEAPRGPLRVCDDDWCGCHLPVKPEANSK